jgi:tetratricopeptide (TPR) repeat protein
VIGWHKLPAKVEGVIEQRLGRLDADLQEALTIASVEGESFTAEVVARVQKTEEIWLVQCLSRKVEKHHRLVQSDSLAWIGTQRLSRYRFRHQLFQQYLYQHLDEMERAYLHEDVGRALEGLYGGEVKQAAARLAWHFEQAGLAEQAVEYLIIAARQAVRLGAHNQVVDHCARALALLKAMPDTAQKAEQELTLQIIQGNVFVATRGYGSPEVKTVFERANELCQQVGQTPQLSRVLFGLWGYYFHQAEHQIALQLGEQALRLANQQPEVEPRMNAHRLLGVTAFYLGRFASSLDHMEQVIQAYEPSRHSALGFVYGSDPCLSALSYAAMCLMYTGFPDRAAVYSQQALQLARDLSYPFALAFALLHALWLYTLHDDIQAILETVDEQMTLASEHGFPIHLAIARYHKYFAIGVSSEAPESVQEMRQAIADWQATGAQCGKAAMLGGIARACLRVGQTEDGLTCISEALSLIRQKGERYDEATQYRIRGELLLEQGACVHEVEASFKQAIEVAHQLDARLSELWATTSLARLWQQQDRGEEARHALAAIYSWFDEGFDSPVLRAARSLLAELS